MPHKDREVRNAYYRKYYQEHKKQMNEAGYKYKRKWRRRIKIEVLSFYSNSNRPKCIWCGEERLACLSIDHINNDGYRERKEKGFYNGEYLYPWLRKNSYPEGYQTLCMNCQFVKREAVLIEKWGVIHS